MPGVLYIRGALVTVTATITPGTTETATIDCWGGGQAGENGGGGGSGAGAGWARKAINLTAGSGFSISIGKAGNAVTFEAGGDTWVVAAGTLLANGGGSATTRIGDSTNAGGTFHFSGAESNASGGGAGGPLGAGGDGVLGSDVQFSGPGGGGANGGGAGNAPTGSAGGAGGGTLGGAGGTTGSVNGVKGGAGGGGGGSFGNGTSQQGVGGDGGDDWGDGVNAGGGGGGGGAGYAGGAFSLLGGRGGTPGGGGGSGDATNGWPFGGYGLIRIPFSGNQPAVSSLTTGGVIVVSVPTWVRHAITRAGRR